MENVPLPPPPIPPTPPVPMKSFLERLQSLEEPMKWRVLVAATAVVMVAVVYIWVGYFNNIVMSNPVELASQSAVAQGSGAVAAPTPTGQSPSATTQNASVPGFWTQLGGGIVHLYQDLAGGLGSLRRSLGGPREYTITPGQ